MITYAHRGLHRDGPPQNSMEAFQAASDAGHGIETDLRDTADGVVVLHHDRCAGGRRVEDMTKGDLERILGRSVPTLDDLLHAGYPVPINLDVKTPRAVALAAPTIAARRKAVTLVTAFRHDIALAAAAIGAEAGYLMASRPSAHDPLPRPAARLRTCVWDFDMVDEELAARCAADGLEWMAYGAVTGGELRGLARLGAAAAITDHPGGWSDPAVG